MAEPGAEAAAPSAPLLPAALPTDEPRQALLLGAIGLLVLALTSSGLLALVLRLDRLETRV